MRAMSVPINEPSNRLANVWYICNITLKTNRWQQPLRAQSNGVGRHLEVVKCRCQMIAIAMKS
jgi:hypothetical protein